MSPTHSTSQSNCPHSLSLKDKRFNADTLNIVVTKESTHDTREIPIITAIPSEHLQKSFVKMLAQTGELSCAGFSKRVVEQAAKLGRIPSGFSVQYIVPPKNKKDNNYQDNFCLMENSVVPLWYKFTPLLTGLEDISPVAHHKNHRKSKKQDLLLPKVPYVMRAHDFKSIQSFTFKKLSFRRTTTQIKPAYEIVSSKLKIYPLAQGLLLYRNGLSSLSRDANLYPMVLEISLPSTIQRHQIKKEYIANKQVLIKQLALENKIPNLTEEQQEEALDSGTLPEEYPYSCHHVLPRILGGTNDLSNLYYIQNDIHRRLHKLIRDYEQYLETAPWNVRHTRLFVVLPMPMDYKGSALRIVKDHHTVLTTDEFLEEYGSEQLQHPHEEKSDSCEIPSPQRVVSSNQEKVIPNLDKALPTSNKSTPAPKCIIKGHASPGDPLQVNIQIRIHKINALNIRGG